MLVLLPNFYLLMRDWAPRYVSTQLQDFLGIQVLSDSAKFKATNPFSFCDNNGLPFYL